MIALASKTLNNWLEVYEKDLLSVNQKSLLGSETNYAHKFDSKTLATAWIYPNRLLKNEEFSLCLLDPGGRLRTKSSIGNTNRDKVIYSYWLPFHRGHYRKKPSSYHP